LAALASSTGSDPPTEAQPDVPLGYRPTNAQHSPAPMRATSPFPYTTTLGHSSVDENSDSADPSNPSWAQWIGAQPCKYLISCRYFPKSVPLHFSHHCTFALVFARYSLCEQCMLFKYVPDHGAGTPRLRQSVLMPTCETEHIPPTLVILVHR